MLTVPVHVLPSLYSTESLTGSLTSNPSYCRKYGGKWTAPFTKSIAKWPMIFLHFSYFFSSEENRGKSWNMLVQDQHPTSKHWQSIPDLSMLKPTVTSSLVHHISTPRWSQYEININKYQQPKCYTKIKIKTINKISTPFLKRCVLK